MGVSVGLWSVGIGVLVAGVLEVNCRVVFVPPELPSGRSGFRAYHVDDAEVGMGHVVVYPDLK